VSILSEIKPEAEDGVRDSVTVKAKKPHRIKPPKPDKKDKTKLMVTAVALGKPTKRKKGDPDSDLPYPITKVARAIDSHGEPSEKIVVLTTTEDGRIGRFVLTETALISGQYTDLAKMVIKLNLRPYKTPKGMRELTDILLQAADKLIYIAEHEGYHLVRINGHHFDFFVWRGKVFPLGPKCPVPVVPLVTTAPLPPASCSLEDWNKHVGIHIVANPYMLVTFLAAISALLVQVFHLPRLILMLVGGSSTGKNSTQITCQSPYQPGTGEIDNFSGTEKGIQALLRPVHDMPKMMEELRQAENFDGVLRLIFDLASGASRKTSTADQQLMRSMSLTCGLIISNENTLMEMAGRETINEGLAARFLELHANAPHGMFHSLPEGMTAAEFSDMLKDASSKYYGAFWDAWVDGVAGSISKLRVQVPLNLPKLMSDLCEDMDINDPVTKRMVNGMAGWACAGVIACKLKLLPAGVDRTTIVNAMRLVLREHLARQKHNTTPVGEKVISAVRDVIDRQAGRFPSFATIKSTSQMGIYGYRKTTRDETLYLFFPSVFEELIGEKFGTDAALRQLKAAGYLSTDSEGFQRQFRLPGDSDQSGPRKRFYAIKAAICYETEESSD
jgi:hypothetical protein